MTDDDELLIDLYSLLKDADSLYAVGYNECLADHGRTDTGATASGWRATRDAMFNRIAAARGRLRRRLGREP